MHRKETLTDYHIRINNVITYINNNLGEDMDIDRLAKLSKLRENCLPVGGGQMYLLLGLPFIGGCLVWSSLMSGHRGRSEITLSQLKRCFSAQTDSIFFREVETRHSDCGRLRQDDV